MAKITTIDLEMESAGTQIRALHLDDLFDPYLLACERSGVVDKTIDSYTHQLRPFRLWWAEYGPANDYLLSEESLRTFGHWLRHEYSTNLGKLPSQNTQRSCCRRVRQFFTWLYRTGRLPVQISEWVGLPAAPQPEGRCLDAGEIEALFHACHGMYRLRNAALLAFLFETGARCIEAANAMYDEVTILPNYTGYCRLTFVKRNKDIDLRRTVAFGQTTGVLLKVLAFMTGRTSGKIFELSDKGIQYVMRALSARTDIECGAHDARKTFATYWTRNFRGQNPYLGEILLKKQLGHRPGNVLEKHYLKLDHTDILRDYVSPLDPVDIPGLKMVTALARRDGTA